MIKVGRLKNFVHEWKKITNDQWVLKTIQGYEISFNELPYQKNRPSQIAFDTYETSLVDEEVTELWKKGAIREIDLCDSHFLSNIFVVPKKNGKLRPVINLRSLNEFVTYEKFKQENLGQILNLIQKGDHFCSVDLKDAYLSVPIANEYQKYLCFQWKERFYCFVVLPFGLSSAPRIFTKILKPVYAYFRSMGIRCTYYLDDSLIMNKNIDDCRKNTQIIMNTLNTLGFQVNLDKSVSEPTQIIEFFGLIIDSRSFKVYLPKEKIERLLEVARKIMEERFIKIRDLATLIGLIIHACNAISPGQLYYRSLERDKIKALNKNDKDYEGQATLSTLSRLDLNWWIENIELKNGKLIRLSHVDYWIETDASLKGMGAVFGDKNFSKSWSSVEEKFHINYLELLAIYLALKFFFKEKHNVHIGVKCDNTTAIAYVNNMGGMISQDMDYLARNIWEWCFKRNIWVTCQYLPGKSNELADYFSRETSSSAEWSLKPEIYERILKQYFSPDVDLFASFANHKIEKFVTWKYCPQAWKIDAFSFTWKNLNPYIFPPFHLLGKILNKIIEDKVDKAIVVFPVWKSQSWFPLLLSMLISVPVRLPRHTDLMTDGERKHPLNKTILLAAALISGKHWRIEGFQKTLESSCSHHAENQQGSSMTLPGKISYFGVINGIDLQMKLLRKN